MARRTLPIVRAALPVGLAEQKNGRLQPGVLTAIQPVGRLYHPAAASWTAMRAAAEWEGVPLAPTSAADTYRTLATQTAVFQARYTKKRLKGRPGRKWNGEAFYLRKGLAPVAVPGTSNHGWGLAVDVKNVTLDDRLEWLLGNAERFGWSWELQSEPWHIRYVLGDSLPEGV